MKIATTSLLFLACSSVAAQVPYTFWELSVNSSSAMLASALDYEAPAGLIESFSCKRGSTSIKIRQYFRDSAEDPETRKKLVRSANFKKGCDNECKRGLALFYTPQDLRQIPDLVPVGSWVSTLEWSQAKEMVVRRLQDRSQFGDLTEQQQVVPRKRNASRLKHFEAVCALP